MCWLYSVPNFLVIQNVETLYLGGNNVRVVCERVWRNSSWVHLRGVSQLDLATDSRLASRQSVTRVKYAGSWRVMTARALQDKKYSLAWQLTRDSFQSRGRVTRMPYFAKNWFFTFLSYLTINTLIPTKCIVLKREPIERKTLRNVSIIHPPY